MPIEELVGPALTVSFLLALVLERVFARTAMPPVRFWRWLGFAFFVVTAAVNIGLPLLLPLEWIAAHSLLPGHRLGTAGGFALGFLVWGFVYYWFHRLEHRFDIAWRWLHQIHHSAERVDAAGFAFTHPLEMIAMTLISIAVNVGVLGLAPEAAALVGFYGALAALVQHLNLRTPLVLEWFMQRPEAHLRHHEYGVHAFNYADWPVWDKLFGTYREAPSQPLRFGFGRDLRGQIPAMLAGSDPNRPGADSSERGATARVMH